MNKKTIEGKRKELRGKVSNDRLDMIAAKRDQLEGEIQQAFMVLRGVTK